MYWPGTSSILSMPNLYFSMVIEIDHHWEEGWEPLCFDLKEISAIPKEQEFLFHPFSFF